MKRIGRQPLDEAAFRGVCAGVWDKLARGMTVRQVRKDLARHGYDAHFAHVVGVAVARQQQSGRSGLTPQRAHVRARRRATRAGATIGLLATGIGIGALAAALHHWGRQAVGTQVVMALAAIGLEELLRHGVAWLWWTLFARG